ncbi:MAG TPA: preprotein translocase subunit SecG, partial [Candidatus Ratteibacteria bacterium]|nr:preprotein translocase subunit SecG [Candidatus Ratteibacteria bacterium]
KMYTFLLVFHIIVCLLLMFFVLIQSGKGSSMANIFGGGGMETVFGAETPTILNRITTILAIIFIVSSLILAVTPGKLTNKSILKQQVEKTENKIPPASQ